jgi:hypothetical protein
MRSALLISAGMALAMAGQAFAATPPSSAMPGASPSTQSMPSTSRTTQPPATSSSPTGSGADTSATAGAAGASLSVGEPVKDNTGATIGAISSLAPGANGQQMAVIKMGNDSFQVSSDKLGAGEGAATINLSQSQITAMLHPAAGGK